MGFLSCKGIRSIAELTNLQRLALTSRTQSLL